MSSEDQPPRNRGFVSDLRDTVGRKVSENETGIRDRLGKAARWVDQRTGGRYSEQIGKAEAAVGQGVGRLAEPPGSPGAGPDGARDGLADAPTPPQGTRMPGPPGPGAAPGGPGDRPGGGPTDVRDDAPTGPIPSVPPAAARPSGRGGPAGPAGATVPTGGATGPVGAGPTERIVPGEEGTERLPPPRPGRGEPPQPGTRGPQGPTPSGPV